MADVNCFTVVGRLTKDAVVKVFPNSGKKYMLFDIANNTGWGEHALVNFFHCKMIGDKRVEALQPYLVKGKLIGLTGELNQNDWTNNEGKKVHDWQLVVNQLQLLGGGREGQNDGSGQPSFEDDVQDAEYTVVTDDELKKRANARTAAHKRSARGKPGGGEDEIAF